tara:strand:+ start:846 stop:1079 length:234 start_codon:yes stop_codon:yes gene_type:complete
MKLILAPILLLTLLFSSLAFGETVEWSELVKRDSLYYKKFSKIPFTGKVTGSHFHSSDKGTYKNGEKHGPWIIYWGN